MRQVVVVGAGQAGASLVAKLRAEGFDGAITLIGAEPVPPYQRPPLSKGYLLGEMARERLYLRPETFYCDANITLRTGISVTAIDRAAQAITAGGESIPYDDLVLATGSEPRRIPAALGGDLRGVFTVRDLGDVDGFEPFVREGARVLVIGGGYIGLEAAAVAAKKGVSVTLVEMAERILSRVAAPETADYFRALHRSHGVDLREGVALKRLIGSDDRLTGAELSDGSTLDLDFALVGVGITPRTELAEAAGLAIENGIRVDELGRSSDPAIWAVGDCASFPWRGARLRLESVQNAIDHAEQVARNIMGAGESYKPSPWFWSDQFDVKLQIAGLHQGHDRVVTRPGAAAGAQSCWYYGGPTLLAVDAMNDARAFMIGKRLIEAGKSPAPEIVADPATDLKALLQA
jgi:3-phenylpropionate/trans-cinnamate dioxygenase ferredoxin reductase subunit